MSEFPFDIGGLAYKPRYNVAPTQQVLTYGSQGHQTAEFMRWGLVPFWAKDLSIGNRMINARAETVATSNAFKTPLKRRRCLVLADGFYEWKKEAATNTPMRITLKSKQPFGFAGLWEEWTNKETEEAVRSCTIITTEPNELMEPIHNRMPVILPREADEVWLDEGIDDPDRLTPLLQPHSTGEMEAYAVSTLVHSMKNEDPGCIIPV